MHRDILPQVIFSPGHLAIELANGLSSNNIDVTLYTPGPIETLAKNVTADLSYFDRELAGRGIMAIVIWTYCVNIRSHLLL